MILTPDWLEDSILTSNWLIDDWLRDAILTYGWLKDGILTSYWLTVSFEHSLVSGHHYIGYTAWESLNRQYSVNNVTIIVRLEFDRFSYKHKRLKKTYNR